MKNLAVFVAVILFSSNINFAQCEKSTDPFSNQPVKSFVWKTRGLRTLYYETRNGKSTLEFRVGEIGAIEYTISKGSDVLIKVESGDIIKMVTLLDARSVVASTIIDADNNVTFSSYLLKMEITEDQLKTMAKSRVTDMQFPDLHGGVQTYDTRELRNKFERYLMEGAKCLLDIN